MAIKVGGVEVIDNARAILGVSSVTTTGTIDAGAFAVLGVPLDVYSKTEADALYVNPTTATTYTAPQIGAITVDNDMSFDMLVSDNFKSTPTGSATLTFTNITSGAAGNIYIDNSASAVISAAVTTYISPGDLSVLNSTGIHWLSYYSDGTNVLCSVSGSAVSGGV